MSCNMFLANFYHFLGKSEYLVHFFYDNYPWSALIFLVISEKLQSARI